MFDLWFRIGPSPEEIYALLNWSIRTYMIDRPRYIHSRSRHAFGYVQHLFTQHIVGNARHRGIPGLTTDTTGPRARGTRNIDVEKVRAEVQKGGTIEPANVHLGTRLFASKSDPILRRIPLSTEEH